jgi:hypothetical protein
MRRPINWFVFCLSLAFLFANLSFGNRPEHFVSHTSPSQATVNFSHVTVGEPAAPQFGYVRADGSFLPLARQQDSEVEILEMDWSAPSAASKIPARF